MGRILFVLLVGCWMLSGCQTFNTRVSHGPQKLKVNWINATEPDDYIFQPLLHRMKPLVFEDLVIAGNGLDNISAYKIKTGQVLWRLGIQGGVEGGAALSNGKLYFGGNDGNFYCVDAKSGVIRWKVFVGAEVLAAPQVEGDKVFFIGGNNMVHALKAVDGTKVWAYSRQQPTYFSVRAASTPLIFGNQLLVGTADGYIVSLNVSSGTLLWERLLNNGKKFRDVDATPLKDGDRVYISSFDGSLYCLDINSGKVLWKYDEGGYVPPLMDGDLIFYPTTTRKVVALNKMVGKEVWKLENTSGISTEISLIGEQIVFGESSGDIRLINAKSGKIGPRYSTGRGLIATPAYDDKSKMLFVISNSANLLALHLEED